MNFQPKYWLGTSVLVHPQKPQPNSGAVNLVSWLELRHGCSSSVLELQTSPWTVSGSPGRHESAQPRHRWHGAWKETWPVAEVNNGHEANFAMLGNAAWVRRGAGSRLWARPGRALPACPHGPHTLSSTLPSRDFPTLSALTTKGGI